MISRKLNWVESVNSLNEDSLAKLESQLANFYSNNESYYGEINFTAGNWTNRDEVGYQVILDECSKINSICEVGCGSANMLMHAPELRVRYSGCDFSEKLMDSNRRRYPEAIFKAIENSKILPFPDNSFDLVFSVFVIEHSVRPADFLRECARILKPNGKLIVLCPDFLKKGRMTSQRAGWSEGTAKKKLKEGKLLDAITTLFDNRIRIPFFCRRYAERALKSPLFLINISPVVFEDPFSPDVDAVYLTFKDEMTSFLRQHFAVVPNNESLTEYERKKGLIFLLLEKKKLDERS